MKILVFSDSHQRNNYMKAAIDMHTALGTVDCIFHLGDGVKDLECLSPQIPVCYVDGNYEEYITSYLARKNLKTETILDLGGFRFFLTHGHRYGVKGGLASAVAAAKHNGANVLVYGHTHEQHNEYLPPSDDEEHGLYIFNPGSISRPRDNVFSYGLIEIRNGNILISHGSIQ
ncbi:MAG: metallophosphoesterase family protein [Clostridia bacterium]|nr:metallophosphoesterase family protein [Clostridia bacterium]